MAVILASQPQEYGLAYNDNPFVFYSTEYYLQDSQRFKVIILPDGWPVTPPLATVRVFPRVGVSSIGSVFQNRAYYDPSRILQSQLETNVSIPSANHPTIFSNSNMAQSYGLFIQEEYKVGGVYVTGASIITEVKTVWNGVNNLTNWLDFDYTDYDNAVTKKKFLTYAPRTQYIDSNQSAFLYFMTSNLTRPTSVQLTGYNAAGSIITNGVIDITTTEKFNRIAIGTYDIVNSDPFDWSSGLPSTFLTGVSYYTVSIKNVSILTNSETFTYYVDSKCSKYTPIRLHWLNRLGGFDSFNFIYKSEVDTDVKRSSYLQEHHNFTGSSWEYNKASRGNTVYNVEMTSTTRVNTDFLTDSESEWMEDLFTSPVVYQELNNELIAVTIDGKNIKRQTSLNDKLAQYTFDFTEALVNTRQRG
jgi:hypothetical protein